MRVIGLMSGTSLDGLDIISVKLDFSNQYRFEVEQFTTIEYTPEWRMKLSNAHALSKQNLDQLSIDFGIFMGETVNHQLEKWELKAELIASHGQTVFHNPEAGFTLQIGNGPEIHHLTGIPVVCDFRPQDVALGGQGAPLVPIIDRLLFGHYDGCLNLGGFSNISTEVNNQRIAWDIAPVNFVMNELVRHLDLNYDDDGKIARSGHVHQELLEHLEAVLYYHAPPPKSLGREWVESYINPIIGQYKLPVEDQLRTFVEHVSLRIAHDCKNLESILITGGGAWNSFLIERIKTHHSGRWIIPDQTLVNGKEALAFATLGYLRWHEQVNVLASVTGALKDHSSGVIFGKY